MHARQCREVQCLDACAHRSLARAFVATPEFVNVRADITKAVKEAFDANGVTIPFQHVVYVPYKAPGSDTGDTATARPPMTPPDDD